MAEEDTPWGVFRPFDEEAVRRHNEDRLDLFLPWAEHQKTICDPNSVMDIAVDRAREKGLPEVAGLLVYVSREKLDWRARARSAERSVRALHRALTGGTVEELKAALGEDGFAYLHELLEEDP